MGLRFYVADTLAGQLVGRLYPTAWDITEPVTGSSGGTLTLALPPDPTSAGRLASLLTPRMRQVIVRDTSAGAVNQYVFGGPIPRRPANNGDGTISVPIVDWRYWFYATILRPRDTSSQGLSSGPYGPGDYIESSVDQATAMTALMADALNSYATPKMVVDTAPDTGVDREVTIRALNRYLGDELDAIRDRNGDGTCDWYTYMTRSGSVFTAHVAVAWPQRASRTDPIRLEYRLGKGGPVSAYTWPEGQDAPTRVYATGEGTPPDQVWAYDELPDLTDDPVTDMVWEQLIGPQEGVVKASTCFDDASATVQQTADLTGQATVTVATEKLPVNAIVAGDRARLILSDGWTDVDLPAVRIIQREFTGGVGQPSQQVLTLDLTDPVPLPVDNPGVVGDAS